MVKSALIMIKYGFSNGFELDYSPSYIQARCIRLSRRMACLLQ